VVRAATPPIREGKSSTTCLTHSGQVSSLLALSFSASSVSFTVLSKDFWSARGGRKAGAPAEVEVPTKVPVEAPAKAEVSANAQAEAEVSANAQAEAEVSANAQAEAEVSANAQAEAEVSANAQAEADVPADASRSSCGMLDCSTNASK
jgi:cytoskeletal protein RodZ